MSITLITIILAASYLLGFIFAIFALWRGRTPQGTAAWVIALISIPVITIPAFLVFGRNKFYNYSERRRKFDKKIKVLVEFLKKVYELESTIPDSLQILTKIAHQNEQPSFTQFNKIELLIDGNETYESMFEAIEKAKKYILFQFYIFRNDDIGNQFKELLRKKSREGVKVYFMFDTIGSSLSKKFLSELESAGVFVAPFKSTKGWTTRLQINFRNHRKIVVVDGVSTFLGGLNVGDDYLGKYKDIGPWRDTHVKIEGPAALSAQLSFIKDWNWVRDEFLELNWEPEKNKANNNVMVLHTGPADNLEAALLFYIALVQSAKSKIWLATPYFIPPEGFVNALSLAAQQGVDVRIILPGKNDNRIVDLASKVYIQKLLNYGVKFYKHSPGFAHQKTMLVDDLAGVVGSTNLDSRSLFINFEIQTVTTDQAFINNLNKMFKKDFENASEILIKYFEKQKIGSELISRAANLFSPML